MLTSAGIIGEDRGAHGAQRTWCPRASHATWGCESQVLALLRPANAENHPLQTLRDGADNSERVVTDSSPFPTDPEQSETCPHISAPPLGDRVPSIDQMNPWAQASALSQRRGDKGVETMAYESSLKALGDADLGGESGREARHPQ